MGKKLTMGEVLEKKPGDRIKVQESGNAPDLILGANWIESEIFECTDKTAERIIFKIVDKTNCLSYKGMFLETLGEGDFFIDINKELPYKDNYDMFSKSGTKCNIYEVD